MQMQLCEKNYYSKVANYEYMSVSQFKEFSGTISKSGCEAQALALIKGKYEKKKSVDLLVGSYVDSYFEGTLEQFKLNNPEIYKMDGTLKAPFLRAENMIDRLKRDRKAMAYLSGSKQVIMTGVIGGAKWKIKMDSYTPGKAIIDLKTVKDIHEKTYVKDLGYEVNFIENWGYYLQGAVYREIVRQNTGQNPLPFYILAVSKEEEPAIELIQLEEAFMKEAFTRMELQLPHILDVKYGRVEPTRCGRCNYCKSTYVITRPILSSEL